MRLALITVKRRPGRDAGAEEVSRRETLIEGETLRIGRGVQSDIHLPDVTVDGHHATLRAEDGVLVIEPMGDAPIRVDGKPRKRRRLPVGSVAQIGGFALTVEPAPDGADFALAVEAAAPAPTRLAARPQTLAQALPSRRRLAWALTAPLVLLLLVWPLYEILKDPIPPADALEVRGVAGRERAASHPVVVAWTSGPMSRAHDMIGEDCAACHLRPFEMAPNRGCLSCHAEIGRHAALDPHPVAGLDDGRCAACHKEHNAGTGPIERASALCVECHGRTEDMLAYAPETRLRPASDFGRAHPNFRIMGGVLPHGGSEGLKFPHDRHLTGRVAAPLPAAAAALWRDPPPGWARVSVEGGERLRDPQGRLFTLEGRADLGCADCHVTQADGMLMRPVEMERDCAWCHQLKIDTLDTARAVPHAMEDEVSAIVRDYYRARALEGGITRADAPPFARRPRGEPFRPPAGLMISGVPMEEALGWAADQAERHLARIFKDDFVSEATGEVSYDVGQGLCAYCHRTERAGADEDGVSSWRVLPVRLQRHWMPMARFDHGPHASMDCVGCHEATTSKTSADVLMPQIGVCLDCHRGEATRAPSASSECVACHGFHNDGHGAISPAHARLWDARRREGERAAPAPDIAADARP